MHPNKHYILYIVMDETTRFTSHVLDVKKTELYCIARFICDYNASFDYICALKCTKLSCNLFLEINY